MEPRFPLHGVAVNVRSLYNIGAIFRASDAARVAHLHLTGGCGHPGTQGPRIEKTALGTTATVPWSYDPDPLATLARLRAGGLRLVALEPGAGRPVEDLPLPPPGLALVVGHETLGLPPEVMAACDEVAVVRTWGTKPSLNVALAYGVAMLSLAGRWAAANGCREAGGVL